MQEAGFYPVSDRNEKTLTKEMAACRSSRKVTLASVQGRKLERTRECRGLGREDECIGNGMWDEGGSELH